MGILSKLWNGTVGRLVNDLVRDNKTCYYIGYDILAQAVAPIPDSPGKLSEEHLGTARKWELLAQWVQKSGGFTNIENDKANLGLISLYIDNIAEAIKMQPDKPFIEIDREYLDYIHRNAPYFLESIRYYQPRFSDSTTNVVDLNNTIRFLNRHTGVQPPENDPAYPDKSGYIQHFYQTIIRDLDLKPTPARTHSL